MLGNSWLNKQHSSRRLELKITQTLYQLPKLLLQVSFAPQALLHRIMSDCVLQSQADEMHLLFARDSMGIVALD